jgi:uncharacterized protein YjbJ (UPF0337 family)
VHSEARRLEPVVDKNRIEGAAEDAVGEVQDAVGGLTGDIRTQAAGKMRQAAGTVQNAYGKISDEVRNATENIIEASSEQPVAVFLVALVVGFLLGRISATFRR